MGGSESGSLVAATMTLPRATTPVTSSPSSGPAPRDFQVAPPSTDRRRPVWWLPTLPKLLVSAMPATSVLLVASVGSSVSAPMDTWGPRSSSGTQCGLGGLELNASVVFQTPPLTVPTHKVPGWVGCWTTASMAPATGLFWAAMPATGPPWITVGPCATKAGAPNATTGAVNGVTASIGPEKRRPGVRPALMAAASIAVWTSLTRSANPVLVASGLTRTFVSAANGVVFVSLLASAVSGSTCTPSSAPMNSTV